MMDYDMVNKMKVDELKMYLRLRGIRVTGKKAELVSRVFVASERNEQPIKTAAEVEKDLRDEYQAKLLHGEVLLSDPVHLLSGWLGEEEGIPFWPFITYPDIFNYLTFNPSELSSSDLNDYKNSKAYSYFNRGWLGNIFYHGNGDSSAYCFLKSDCRPSERLNDPPHKLWACILKKSSKVLSAYCSCMAGMSGTCNHVAALLFRVEAAVRLGLTNPSCTTKSCEWLPNRKNVQPTKVKNLSFSRDDFGKRGKKTRQLVSTPKKEFNPLANTDVKPLQLNDIAESLKTSLPDSVLYSAIPKPKIDFVRDIVKPFVKSNDLVSIDDIILMSNSVESFHRNLHRNINFSVIEKIEFVTRGQSSNESWFLYRKGVITGSKGHEVKTKMKKLKKGGGSYVNLWQLFQKISGLVFTNPNIPALKYGRSMEENAVNEFFNIKSKEHKDFKLIDCGLFLDNAKPFIGASPDRIISCSCCPRACLEVKCPYSVNFLSPKDPNFSLPYLQNVDGKLVLKESDKYFTQCQMQMGVTGCKLCYFFVWTPHGYILNELVFNLDFWNDLVLLFSDFHDLYLQSLYS